MQEFIKHIKRINRSHILNVGQFFPMIMIYHNNKVSCLVCAFENQQEKHDFLAIGLCVAAQLEDVTAINFTSESWMQQFTQDDEPELWERSGHDLREYQYLVKQKYPDFEKSPYKKEIVVSMIEDNKHNKASLFAEIIRDKNEKVIDLKYEDEEKIDTLGGDFAHLYSKLDGLKQTNAAAVHFFPESDVYTVYEVASKKGMLPPVRIDRVRAKAKKVLRGSRKGMHIFEI